MVAGSLHVCEGMPKIWSIGFGNVWFIARFNFFQDSDFH